MQETLENFIEQAIEKCEGSREDGNTQMSQAAVVGKLALFEFRRFMRIIEGDLLY